MKLRPTGSYLLHESRFRGRGRQWMRDLAVGKPRQTIARARYTQLVFDIRIPGIQFACRKRPDRTFAIGRNKVVMPQAKIETAMTRYSDTSLQAAGAYPEKGPVRRGRVGTVEI